MTMTMKKQVVKMTRKVVKKTMIKIYFYHKIEKIHIKYFLFEKMLS